MSLESAYGDVVAVERNTPTDDGHGGSADNWAETIAAYRCAIFAKTGQITRTEAGDAPFYTHRFIGSVAEILDGDKFVDEAGRLLLVIQIDRIKKGKTVVHLEGTLRRIPR